MCGIFGITHLGVHDQERARKALHSLEHRGPDQWGELLTDGTYLGHRRLSILDLSEAGRQPMLSSDENIALIANGEIYNYRKLRSELGGQQVFRSDSDSEVLLKGYQTWGIKKLLERIDGMYAFAIFDKVKRKIYLAVDRAGIKPIYYGIINNQFVWASELKAIEKYFSSSLKIDGTALYDFLTYRYIPGPKSKYQGIYKLEPGHYLNYDTDENIFRLIKYWDLPTQDINITSNEAQEQLRYLLTESVREQMVSDVPVGFFLSGGIDSSCVVATAAKINSHVQTFTIGFNDDLKDESIFAEYVSTLFNTTHSVEYFDKNSSCTSLEKLKHWYDEPFADTSAFPSYLVSKLARQEVKVVLTGDGGDELFGGYRWYQRFIRRYNFRKTRNLIPAKLDEYLKSGLICMNHSMGNKINSWLFHNDFENYAYLLSGKLKGEKIKYAHEWGIPSDYDDYWLYRKYYHSDLPIWKRLRYLDFNTYLPYDILAKVDRVSMVASLEARVPFLSRRMMEFAFALPDEICLPNSELKGILKNSFSEILPDSILKRPKQGFSIPKKLIQNGSDLEKLLKVFGCHN